MAKTTNYKDKPWRFDESKENFDVMVPWFYNDLKFIGNPRLEEMLIAYLEEAVKMGEAKFDQAFGGWKPASNQFGITTLRPHHVNNGPTASDNRWLKTHSSTTSLDWAAEESFISMTFAEDEIALIYGIFNLETQPNTIELFIQPGTQKLPIFTLEPMQAKSEQYMILPEPILLEPRSPLMVKESARTINVEEQMGFLGYFIAPASTLIVKT